MSLTSAQALLAVTLIVAPLALGLLVGRWIVAVVPAAAILALHLALSRDEWYSKVSEDWQATLYFGLIPGSIGAVAGVLLAKRRRRAETTGRRRTPSPPRTEG